MPGQQPPVGPVAEQDPPGEVLADAADELGWDRAVHGLMADQATPDSTVVTAAWEAS